MKRHGVGRMLAVMESYGSITAEMRRAGLELHQVMITASDWALLPLGLLGLPASSCAVAVLGRRGQSLRQWATQSWQGQPVAQETASGILVAALAALADGFPRRLLDEALALAAGRSTATRRLALHGGGVPTPGDDRRPHRHKTAAG
jgi:hypothetical protein